MATAKTGKVTPSGRLLRWLSAEFKIYMALGVSSPGGMTGEDAKRLLTEVDHVLDKGTFDAKFSKAIAQRFDESTKQARADLFIRLALVGIVVYNLFLFVDALIIPDAFRLALLIQLGFATPIVLGAIIASRRFDFDTDAAGAVLIAAMGAGSLAMFMASRSQHVTLFPAVFALFLLSANVAQALFFNWAAGFTLLFTTAASIAVVCHPVLDVENKIFWIVIFVSTAQYSLAGNYRINAGVRRAYLFALRESLRAQLLFESNTELISMVGIDSLTNIGNRRHFDRSLDHAWRHRQGDPVAVLMIDIDHFKRLNDTFGHQAGDRCLQQVARVLSGVVDSHGVTARYGGEEFAVILPGFDGAGAFATAERLRRTVETFGFEIEAGGQSLDLTVSIGCAASRDDTIVTASGLVSAADGALYDAKRSGRNRNRLATFEDIVPLKSESRKNGSRRLMA